MHRFERCQSTESIWEEPERGTFFRTTLRSTQQPMRQISWAASLCLPLPVDNKTVHTINVRVSKMSWPVVTISVKVMSGSSRIPTFRNGKVPWFQQISRYNYRFCFKSFQGFPDVVGTLVKVISRSSVWKMPRCHIPCRYIKHLNSRFVTVFLEVSRPVVVSSPPLFSRSPAFSPEIRF